MEYFVQTIDHFDQLETGQIIYKAMDDSQKKDIEDLHLAAGINLKFRFFVYTRIRSVYGPYRYTIGIMSSIVDIMGPQKE